jgi:hypothetical protein
LAFHLAVQELFTRCPITTERRGQCVVFRDHEVRRLYLITIVSPTPAALYDMSGQCLFVDKCGSVFSHQIANRREMIMSEVQELPGLSMLRTKERQSTKFEFRVWPRNRSKPDERCRCIIAVSCCMKYYCGDNISLNHEHEGFLQLVLPRDLAA